MFRVHGGAFQVGNLGTRENADYLMDEDVVLVQIHYRLGGFGESIILVVLAVLKNLG